jgi:hypothetical protein
MWLRLSNIVPWLKKHLMLSISSPRPGSRYNPMFLMVCNAFSVASVFSLSFAQLICFISSVIRASVPKLNLDAVFEQKNDIAKAVEEELEKVINLLFLKKRACIVVDKIYSELRTFFYTLQAMSTYGYEIVQTLIVDIEPDVHVKRAMNEINAGNFFLF